MANKGEPTVAINAQLDPGAGGVASNLLSMLRALSGLPGGRQVVIGLENESLWLAPHLGNRQAILEWPLLSFGPIGRPGWIPPPLWELGKVVLGRSRFGIMRRGEQFAGRVIGRLASGERGLMRLLVEKGVGLVHFPYQAYFPTELPTIYEPWDLQHRHYPEFFSRQEIDHREAMYRSGCEAASLVVVPSEWGKRDLMREFGVPSEKVAVIRRGAYAPRRGATSRQRVTREEAARALQALRLPDRFIFYPARTWPHKNHLRLLEALATLRERSRVVVPLVCTGGAIESHWPHIQRCMTRLNLRETVFFTGQVENEQMVALFSAAEFLIFPSLFEGLGIPLLEAMEYDLPVVTSNAACLPEVGGDAARYFDPLRVDAIADTIAEVWSRPSALEGLRARGRARLTAFDWDVAARQYVACYRHVAGGPLVPEDARVIAVLTGRHPALDADQKDRHNGTRMNLHV